MRRTLVAGCAALASLCCAVPAANAAKPAAPKKPPSTSWVGDPGAAPWVQVPKDQVSAQCGLDPKLMAKASLIMSATPFVIVRNGKLCWTGGYKGGATKSYAVNSVTKSMGAILFGMVSMRSSMRDTDLVSRWLSPAEMKGINPKATLAHVLAMTSTTPDLSYGKKKPWTYDSTGSREINRLVPVMNHVIEREPKNFPGVQNIGEFAQKYLFNVLGMRDSTWPGQVIYLSLMSSPEDLARMGLLVLRHGVWNGKRLFTEQYAYRMTHPAFEDINTGYGYLTYVNAAKNWHYSTGDADTVCEPYGTWPSYPHAPFKQSPGPNGGSPFPMPAKYDVGVDGMFGAGGQRVSWHPALDMVIVVRDEVVSLDAEDPGLFEGHKNVWTKIRPALVADDPRFKGNVKAFCTAYQQSEYAPDLRTTWTKAASS